MSVRRNLDDHARLVDLPVASIAAASARIQKGVYWHFEYDTSLVDLPVATVALPSVAEIVQAGVWRDLDWDA